MQNTQVYKDVAPGFYIQTDIMMAKTLMFPFEETSINLLAKLLKYTHTHTHAQLNNFKCNEKFDRFDAWRVTRTAAAATTIRGFLDGLRVLNVSVGRCRRRTLRFIQF